MSRFDMYLQSVMERADDEAKDDKFGDHRRAPPSGRVRGVVSDPPGPLREACHGPISSPRRADQTVTTVGTSAPADRSTLTGWLALAVPLGIISLMTSEVLPVGLLTPVGSALDVSKDTAGPMVTVPGHC